MHRTWKKKSAPVITLLSNNPAASRKTQDALQSLFSMQPVRVGDIAFTKRTRTGGVYGEGDANTNNDDENDELNQLIHPLLRQRWNSEASICRSSGTILHFLSLDSTTNGTRQNENKDNGNDSKEQSKLESGSEKYFSSLLSITSGPPFPTKRSIENSNINHDYVTEAIQTSRRLLALHMRCNSSSLQFGKDIVENGANEMSGRPWKLNFQLLLLQLLGKPLSAHSILGHDDGLPLMKLPHHPFNHYELESQPIDKHVQKDDTSHARDDEYSLNNSVRLREVVLPHNPDSTYHKEGSTLLSTFSNSALLRPLTGLYQWPKSPLSNTTTTSKGETNTNWGVTFRPLPSTKEDLILPPPSLIFQCNSLPTVMKDIVENYDGVAAQKIGFRGGQYNHQNNSNGGQIRVVGLEGLQGLDVRYCESKTLSSSFSESQEALMAASLEELQNVNVLVEGREEAATNDGKISSGKKETELPQRMDAMNGLGDCWIEFRANMKKPTGFLSLGSNTRGKMGSEWFMKSSTDNNTNGTEKSRIAKAPNLPYE